jgi:hypothetical protein
MELRMAAIDSPAHVLDVRAAAPGRQGDSGGSIYLYRLSV